MSIVFYNYFENITDKFIMTVTYNKSKLITLNLQMAVTIFLI